MSTALRDLGLVVRDIRLGAHQPAGSTVMLAEHDDGPLMITVIGRDELDAQLLAKIARFVVDKHSGPALFLTRLQQVEHEAYLQLLARTGGCGSPRWSSPDAAGRAPCSWSNGRWPVPALGDRAGAGHRRALRDLWDQVGRFHARRIVHGALGPRRVMVTDDGPALVDFSASGAGRPRRRPTTSPSCW